MSQASAQVRAASLAGETQVGRGCAEHIVVIQLLVDTPKWKGNKLFLTFVELCQADGRVPRKCLGGGVILVTPIVGMYRVTQCAGC